MAVSTSSELARRPQRIAIIDLGSNSGRVIVMHTIPGILYHLADEIREVVRLREGLTERGLTEAAMTRALFTLRLFKRFCEGAGAERIIATATSAVREAANGPAFLERVEREVGLSLQILDGEREAYFGTSGALNAVPLRNGVVLDIGGGSAQLSEVRAGRYHRGDSLPLGALALTEGFVTQDPVKKGELKALKQYIGSQLDTLPWVGEVGGELIGLGGTIRNLAQIQAKRQRFPLGTLNGFVLTRRSLERTLSLFRRLPLAERRNISGLNRDRADIILPGAMVLEAVMARMGVEQLTISANGLREGLFFEAFWRDLAFPVPGDLRVFAALNMARFYRYDQTHAAHVRLLSQRLFEQLAPLHGFGRSERELLDVAALLHDVGTVISYNNHHKHSLSLIAGAGLPGFTPRETAMIALLTRYHRKGTPSGGDLSSLLNEGDAARLLCLSALLRLAEYLERGRVGAVQDIRVTWDDETLYLTLVADEYPAVEMWDAQRNALELVEEAFKRAVQLQCTADPTWQVG